MENVTESIYEKRLRLRKHCIKQLIDHNGLLHDELIKIPHEKRSDILDKFQSDTEIQSIINSFFNDIKKHWDTLITMDNNNNVNSGPDNGNIDSRTVKVLSNNRTSEVDSSKITNVDFKEFTQNSTDNSQAVTSQTVPVKEAPVTNIPSTPPPTAQPTPQQQLKPGEIPVTQAPASKSAPVSELSKTSFSMSANGRANEEYRGKITGVNKSGKNVLIKQVDIPADLGLSFDDGTCEVVGIPALAGEFDLKVHFQFDPPSPADPTPIGTCQLIVNPDPKTLWKNLETDKNDKYFKEDTDTIFVPGSDGLAMVVASKRGRSHAHAGTFRDDDFKVDHDVLTGWRIMTVADGAGSAKKSRRGSQIATRVANESIFKALKGERGQKLQDALIAFDSDTSKTQRPVMEELYYLFGNAAREAVHAINTEATTEGVPFKEFSTTLIITIHKKFDFGHFIGAYWVGDGGAGIYLKEQELNVLGKADSGEFAGQTRFLDSAMVEPTEIMNRIRFKVVKDFTAVLAMTDGITDPKFETDANIENIQMWDSLWSELEPTTISSKPNEALLDWLDFWSAGNHDDRTIGILCPIKPGISAQQGAN
jgi:protein phosphatase 2C-like protein